MYKKLIYGITLFVIFKYKYKMDEKQDFIFFIIFISFKLFVLKISNKLKNEYGVWTSILSNFF